MFKFNRLLGCMDALLRIILVIYSVSPMRVVTPTNSGTCITATEDVAPFEEGCYNFAEEEQAVAGRS
jgi:hypothetical protein